LYCAYYLVFTDVGGARSDTVDTEEVVTGTRVAVAAWIVVRPFLLVGRVFGVTAEYLPDTVCNKGESNLAEGGIALASPLNSSFVFARWQHRTDGLAAICTCMFLLGVRPRNLPFPGAGTPCNTVRYWTPQMCPPNSV